MRVILLVPVWSLLATVAVVLPQLRFFVVVFLDLYEGFAISSFMQLIYHYLGGRDQAEWKAEGKESYKCLFCCWWVKPDASMMRVLHVLIYQYAFTRPIFSIIACALYYNGLYTDGGITTGHPAVIVITFSMIICLIVAMFALLQVYRIFSLILRQNRIGLKFMAIKVYIILHATQGFIFAFLVSRTTTDEMKASITRAEYTLLAMEMLVGSILNKLTFFSYQEYVNVEDGIEEGLERVRLTTSPFFKGQKEQRELLKRQRMERQQFEQLQKIQLEQEEKQWLKKEAEVKNGSLALFEENLDDSSFV